MQPLYLHWHGKAELKRILQVLQERGYRNVSDLTMDYSFPVIAIDRDRKIFSKAMQTCFRRFCHDAHLYRPHNAGNGLHRL